jgi:cell shape-determining protein MreC
LLARWDIDPSLLFKGQKEIQLIAILLAHEASERTTPTGQIIWATKEGHSIMDKLDYLVKEVASLSPLREEVSELRKENASLPSLREMVSSLETGNTSLQAK